MRLSARGILGRWRRHLSLLASVTLLNCFPLVASAQLQMPSGSGQGGNPMAPQSLKDAITIEGLTFKVKQLVKNKKQNTLRVVMEAVETQDKGR
jgi:hypothetical protein